MIATALLWVDAERRRQPRRISRCVALADKLASAGWRCSLATRSDCLRSLPDAQGHRLISFDRPAREAADLIGERFPGGVGLLVLDHEDADLDLERRLSGMARRILVVDDVLSRTHVCDLLLRPTTAEADAHEIRDLAPAGALVLAGGEYIPVPDRFVALRTASLRRMRERSGRIERVLLLRGGAAGDRVADTALRALASAGFAGRADVVDESPCGGFFAATVDPGVFAGAAPGRRVDDAALLASSDLVIGAADVSPVERLCLGVPAIGVMTSADGAAGLERNGGALTVPNTQAALHDELRSLLHDPRRVLALSAAAAAACDGRGCERVWIALAGHTYGSRGARVSLRAAEAFDCEDVLRWQSAPGQRRYFRNPDPPSPDEHQAWFHARLERLGEPFAIVAADGEPCGLVRLERRHSAMPCFEISVLLAAEAQGAGLGRAAISLACELAPGAEILAEIHPDNRASLAAFGAAGFAPTGDPMLFRRAPAPS